MLAIRSGQLSQEICDATGDCRGVRQKETYLGNRISPGRNDICGVFWGDATDCNKRDTFHDFRNLL
jgi:hypothetical protein